eukprot:TRINITY_DN949_c0_g1_i2.p1 TRINITY_DN949_c0_g1~~TRINITY_DN949_c0_g1_i2.p1  ORF type:complete len:118 (+),score=13.48 TRINITY_DN949_c0_g1_i2:76-429(+)
MVYISGDGGVQNHRGYFRLSLLVDLFRSFIDHIIFFFNTLITPSSMSNAPQSNPFARRAPGSSSGYSRGDRPDYPPRPRFGGISSKIHFSSTFFIIIISCQRIMPLESCLSFFFFLV